MKIQLALATCSGRPIAPPIRSWREQLARWTWLAVTTAEVADRKGALAAFDRCADNLKQVSSVLVDGGYSGKPFAQAVEDKLSATVQVAKRNELHTFAVMPQRWVVERSFAWLDKCRRLWKNCERKLNSSLQMVHLAFLLLLLRRS